MVWDRSARCHADASFSQCKLPLKNFTVLRVGQRADRVWHFWSASRRAHLPFGKLEGGNAKARVWISKGALLQIGLDYWRDTATPYGPGGNNHEAGASDWYLPAEKWQEATFSDIHPTQSAMP